MLHFDIKVNRHQIGSVQIERLEPARDKAFTLYRATVELNGTAATFTVRHRYDKGALSLIAKAMTRAAALPAFNASVEENP